METTLKGKAWVYGDNVDTDVIIPARYLNSFDPQELASHCMVDIDESFRIGPFGIRLVPLAHSIPESAALLIDTPAGRVVHSGDFKLDPTPVVGEAWDEELEPFRLAAEGAPVRWLHRVS